MTAISFLWLTDITDRFFFSSSNASVLTRPSKEFNSPDASADDTTLTLKKKHSFSHIGNWKLVDSFELPHSLESHVWSH